MGLFDWFKKDKKTSSLSKDTKYTNTSSRDSFNRIYQEEKNKRLDKLIEAQEAVGQKKNIADGVIYDVESKEINTNKLDVKIYEWLDKDGSPLDDYSIRDQFDIEKEISSLDNMMINHRIPKEKYKIFFINDFCFIEKNPRIWIQPFYGKFRLQDGAEVIVKTGQLLSKEDNKFESKAAQARHELGIKPNEELSSERQQEFVQKVRDLIHSNTQVSLDIISKIKISNETNKSENIREDNPKDVDIHFADHSSLLSGLSFKFDEVTFKTIIDNHPNIDYQEGFPSGYDVLAGDDFDALFSLLKSLFPNKHFLMIQKDEYELTILSSIEIVRNEVHEIIYNRSKEYCFQIIDEVTDEISECDSYGNSISHLSYIERIANCKDYLNEEDDTWTRDWFEVRLLEQE